MFINDKNRKYRVSKQVLDNNHPSESLSFEIFFQKNRQIEGRSADLISRFFRIFVFLRIL